MRNEFRQVERHVYCTYASVLTQCVYNINPLHSHNHIHLPLAGNVHHVNCQHGMAKVQALPSTV